MTGLRLTWVQPEDLLGHELRQAEEDGRDARDIRSRWLRAGGPFAPPRAGACRSIRLASATVFAQWLGTAGSPWSAPAIAPAMEAIESQSRP